MAAKTWRMHTIVCDSCGKGSPHTTTMGTREARRLSRTLSGWKAGQGRGMQDLCGPCFRKGQAPA